MKESLISVCIPVFNGEEFIREAIDSVLAQSYPHWELIIVDNCSTDNTLSIAKSYSDPRISVYQNPTNIGLIPNWNKALEYTTGVYIKILPADDLMKPECLALEAKVLDDDTSKSISLVCGRRQIINQSGKVLFTRGFASVKGRVNNVKAINRVIRSGGNIIGEGGAVLFRKEILQKTGNFTSDIFYVLDLDLWFKILLHGDLYVLPEIVSAFRVSSSSSSVKVVKKQKDDYFQFIKNIYQDKHYKLSRFSYNFGLLFTFALTEVKKLIYKFVI